jgi:undecaprenyl-diphosphatase
VTGSSDQLRHVVDRRAALRLLGGGIVLWAVLAGLGWLLVSVATPSAITRWDQDVEKWFVDQRSPLLNQLTHIGSYMSETITCIIVTIVAFVALRLWLGRWRESVTVLIAIAGELFIFLLVTAVVQRDRPDVPQLDAAPPTSSFPSGHVGAAIALYGCLAVIIYRNLASRWLAVTFAILLWCIPVIVGYARLYRGMHFPTDVAGGVMGGGLWLLLTLRTMLPRQPDTPSRSHEDADTTDADQKRPAAT